MSTRMRFILVMGSLVLGPTARAASAETIVGAVFSTSGDTVRIKTAQGVEHAITLDQKTQYVRWITHQPWQQSNAADRAFVTAGRCVAVDLRSGDEHLAKVVRISTDEIGTIYCPCRSGR